MNIDLISGQIALLHITLETAEPYELYGGTTRGAFSFEHDGETWHVTAREEAVAGVPLCNYDIYARELATGREWVILSGKIIVKPRTASVPADKLHPVEYFVTVPVRNEKLDAAGNVIVQGIPGPKGERGEKGEPGEGGMTAEERALLMGAAQRDADNTFSAGNTFTGAVDMSTASVTPPEGWNVGELTAEAIQATAPLKWGDGVNATGAASAPLSLTFGSAFSDTAGSYTSTTEGTGSITIGAGANTLNNGDTESSNSVTIGCKASNSGADSVVLGAQAKATAGGTVAIGAGATSLFNSSVSLGSNSKTEGWCSTAVGTNAYGANGGTAIGLKATARMGLAVGGESVASKYNAMALGGSAKAIALSSNAIGDSTKASADYATAIGRNATAADYGATVIRSTAEDGTYTQLYFSGANTPLANTYANGEAIMGYVTSDKDGNPLASGFKRLSALFDEGTMTQPATLDEFGEWVMPKVFHPSDLDMPVEEPTAPEEYQPLPVYPIVEPEIEHLTE